MRSIVLALVATLLTAASAFAGNSTLTYTSGQSNHIQNRLIPKYNAEKCTHYGLPASCTSADLSEAGCTPKVVRTLTIDACTIFPSTAAGEQAFLQEQANGAVLNVYNRLITTDSVSYLQAECARFKGLPPAQQQTECQIRNQPPQCEPCP